MGRVRLAGWPVPAAAGQIGEALAQIVHRDGAVGIHEELNRPGTAWVVDLEGERSGGLLQWGVRCKTGLRHQPEGFLIVFEQVSQRERHVRLAGDAACDGGEDILLGDGPGQRPRKRAER
jgi:hypothetical protein